MSTYLWLYRLGHSRRTPAAHLQRAHPPTPPIAGLLHYSPASCTHPRRRHEPQAGQACSLLGSQAGWPADGNFRKGASVGDGRSTFLR